MAEVIRSNVSLGSIFVLCLLFRFVGGSWFLLYLTTFSSFAGYIKEQQVLRRTNLLLSFDTTRTE
jgi:hypothetical protein